MGGTGRCKHPRFSFVVNRKVILVRMGEGGQLKMNELTTKE